jgi:hypothetical protein
MRRIFGMRRPGPLLCLAMAGLTLGAAAASAQVRTIDPDAGFDGALAPPAPAPAPVQAPVPAPALYDVPAPPPVQVPPATALPRASAGPVAGASTYRKEELIAASESVFGESARDVAVAIGDILQKQGEPNAYIVGREGGGAFILGLRYGSGTLHQKTREARPVYWSGPSLGFDAGMAAGDTFMLVYNLDDPDALFSRFGSGEGQAYVLGGIHVGYLRKDNVVLIPVRMGVGIRLGINAGYMKFSRKQNLLPF